MFIASTNLNSLKILRMLRILRPLRLIEQYEGLRLSLDALISSLKSIMNILLISLFFFIIFGTMGVNFYKGLYNYCDKTNISSVYSDLLITKWDCLNYGGEYLRRESTFDNVPEALKVLFSISQTCAWTTPMFQSTYAVGMDMVQR